MQLIGKDKTVYLPGTTTHGHYQIELACTACHTDKFGGSEGLQEACMRCHGDELQLADDSHPKSKFTDPRNADRVALLDARKCITCHTEHRQEITRSMGVTLPDNFCYKCHYDVSENRPSHKGMDFSTCASGGCHNFHDNRGLYEDFIAKHLDEPDFLDNASVATLSLVKGYRLQPNYPLQRYPIKFLSLLDSDQPASQHVDPKIHQDWLESSHSQSGVNCTACHEHKEKISGKLVWLEKPDHTACQDCHNEQVKGFKSGMHGMRLAQNLPPMTPALARAQMKKSAFHKQLSCISCHSTHRFDTRHAAVTACLNCHDDKHSMSYKDSSHFKSWYRELNSQARKGTGVSCATCHLPRKEIKQEGKSLVTAEHNQNDNLRPNEKMIRGVCMKCHGLGFSIDALADRQLIEKNFSGKPEVHIKSIELVRKRQSLKKDVKGM